MLHWATQQNWHYQVQASNWVCSSSWVSCCRLYWFYSLYVVKLSWNSLRCSISTVEIVFIHGFAWKSTFEYRQLKYFNLEFIITPRSAGYSWGVIKFKLYKNLFRSMFFYDIWECVRPLLSACFEHSFVCCVATVYFFAVNCRGHFYAKYVLVEGLVNLFRRNHGFAEIYFYLSLLRHWPYFQSWFLIHLQFYRIFL